MTGNTMHGRRALLCVTAFLACSTLAACRGDDRNAEPAGGVGALGPAPSPIPTPGHVGPKDGYVGATTVRRWMTLRNRGTPRGLAAWLGPLMSFMVGRANRKDLASLKRRLEEGVPREPTSATGGGH